MGNEIIVGDWSANRLRAGYKQHANRERTTSKRRANPEKSPELAAFEDEYNAVHYANLANVPPECRVRKTFSDKDANSLTRAIIAHLQLHGHFAARVNTTGIFDSRRAVYRQTNARRGMADVSAVINGRAVQFEIKAGNDRPRTEQLQVRAEVQAAGGIYEFVHTFAEYIAIYDQITAIQGAGTHQAAAMASYTRTRAKVSQIEDFTNY